MNHYRVHKEQIDQEKWIVMMEDLQINHFIRIYPILSIIVDKEFENAQFPNVMDCRFGRSMHHSIIFNISSIPRITNELL